MKTAGCRTSLLLAVCALSAPLPGRVDAIAQEAAGVSICQQHDAQLARCTRTLDSCMRDVSGLDARISEMTARNASSCGPNDPWREMVRSAVDSSLGPVKNAQRPSCEQFEYELTGNGSVSLTGGLQSREELDRRIAELRRSLPGINIDDKLRRLQECLSRLYPGWGYERGANGPRTLDRSDIKAAQVGRLPKEADCGQIGARIDEIRDDAARKASEGFWAMKDGLPGVCEKGPDGKWAFTVTNAGSRRSMLIMKEAGHE